MNPADLLPSAMRRQTASLSVIEREVAAAFGLRPDDLHRQGRPTHIVWPRQVAMHAMRKLTKAPTAAIGKRFGKDRTTVIHADHIVQGAMDSYPKLKREILAIHAKITADEHPADLPKVKLAELPDSEGRLRVF